MGRPRKQPEATGEIGDVPSITAGIEWFKARYPEEWEGMRLGPLEYGLTQIIEKLDR